MRCQEACFLLGHRAMHATARCHGCSARHMRSLWHGPSFLPCAPRAVAATMPCHARLPPLVLGLPVPVPACACMCLCLHVRICVPACSWRASRSRRARAWATRWWWQTACARWVLSWHAMACACRTGTPCTRAVGSLQVCAAAVSVGGRCCPVRPLLPACVQPNVPPAACAVPWW